MSRRPIIPALLLAALAVEGALAQEYRGTLYVTVSADSGRAVVGADVTVSGIGASRTDATDGHGGVRFIKLEPGSYQVKVHKNGFKTLIQRGVVINTSANTSMEARLEPTAFSEEVLVTARVPLLDRRKMGTAIVINPDEIARIPTARDPWAVLSTVPGIQTDRVNVGGSESGRQSEFAGKGDHGNATWVMDGVEFTDLSGPWGDSSTFFDFNSFKEIGFVTGAGDLEQSSPGLRLSFTTKQGTNRHGGSIGLLYAGASSQDTPSSPTNPDGSTVRATSIAKIFEKVFEVGGRIVADRAWYWFGFSHNDIDRRVPGPAGTVLGDALELQNITGKINVALGATTLKAFYTRGKKERSGTGAGPERPEPTTWNLHQATPIATFDVSHFFTRDLEVSLQYGRVDRGFELLPQGTADQVLWDSSFTWQDTYLDYVTEQPQDQLAVRGNWFRDSGRLSHEVKFGFKYKDAEILSSTGWGGQDTIAVEWLGEAWLTRRSALANELDYRSLWLGDTILTGNWTFSVGALYHKQHGTQFPSRSPANGLCPSCLPEVSFSGFDPRFTWEDILPRVGMTYTVDGARRQLVRASAGRYVDQLHQWQVNYNSVTNVAQIDYLWNDLDGDRRVDIGEFDTDCLTGPIRASNVDPCDPAQALSPVHRIDPDLEAPRVDELILGYEVELLEDFTLGLNYTRRERSRTVWYPLRDLVNGGIIDSALWAPATPVSGTVQCQDDVGPCEVPQGASFTVQPYVLTDEGVALTNASRPLLQTNRPGYAEEFQGLELLATKRLSDRWMMRGFVAWQDWTKDITCTAEGPTGECVAGPGIQNPANLRGDTTKDGSDVAAAGPVGLSLTERYGSASWQYGINGLYQLPKNFTISANIHGRRGYSLPLHYQARIRAPDGRLEGQSLQILDVDRYRLDDLHVVDLGFSHRFLSDRGTPVDLSLEVFNLLNDNTTLELSSFHRTLGRIDEVLSPRIIRLAARISVE